MKYSFWLLGVLIIILSACEKDDPVIPNEEELITTLTYTMTASGGAPVVLSFQDLDGDGGNTPIISADGLSANTTYAGVISLLNEQSSPADNITDEVAEEDEEHQLFYQSSVSGLTIAYTDQDADGNPVGLQTTLTTGDPGSGTLTITLRHEPMKGATGVAQGDITNAGGETDIEVTFNINVQ